ncbi:MAG: serine hydrolase [Alphaproteobacteria bacterium]|nr:serine hydrolase [Alphaproteobacteria bacterium]
MLPLLLIAACAPPWMEPVPEERPALDEPLTRALRRGEVMGLAVAVIEDGELSYARGYGDAGLERPVYAGETLFRLGSMSKPITTLGALAAVDAGLLSLDEDVDPLVEAWSPPLSRWGEDGEIIELNEPPVITTRQLLGHLGGLTRMRNTGSSGLPPEAELLEHEGDRDFTWAMAYWSDRPLAYAPGEVFHYTSFGVNLAGAAVEGAVGEPLADWVAREVLDALALSREHIRPEYWWEALPEKADPYVLRGGELQLADGVDYLSAALPASGYLATAEGMAELCRAWMLEAPESWREATWTSQVDGAGEETGYGMGARVWELDGQEIPGHVGGIVGGSGRLLAWPERESCVVLLSNTQHFDAPGLAWELLETLR